MMVTGRCIRSAGGRPEPNAPAFRSSLVFEKIGRLYTEGLGEPY
jgi:hypothetical protein